MPHRAPNANPKSLRDLLSRRTGFGELKCWMVSGSDPEQTEETSTCLRDAGKPGWRGWSAWWKRVPLRSKRGWHPGKRLPVFRKRVPLFKDGYRFSENEYLVCRSTAAS
jgi:hypothetical protein